MQRRRRGLNRTQEIRPAIGRGVRVEHDRHPRDCGRDLLEQLHQFGAHRRLQIGEAGDVAAGFGKAVDEAAADRIGDLREDDGDRPGLRLERCDHRGGMADDQIELHLDEFAREIADALGVARAPAVLDPDVAAAAPAEFLQRFGERGHEGLPGGIVLGNAHEHTDAPHALALGARRSRSADRRAAENGDEFATPHPPSPRSGPRRLAAYARNSHPPYWTDRHPTALIRALYRWL